MKYLYRVAQYGPDWFSAEYTTAVFFGAFPNPFDVWHNADSYPYADQKVRTAKEALAQIDEHKRMNIPSKVTYA